MRWRRIAQESLRNGVGIWIDSPADIVPVVPEPDRTSGHCGRLPRVRRLWNASFGYKGVRSPADGVAVDSRRDQAEAAYRYQK